MCAHRVKEEGAWLAPIRPTTAACFPLGMAGQTCSCQQSQHARRCKEESTSTARGQQIHEEEERARHRPCSGISFGAQQREALHLRMSPEPSSPIVCTPLQLRGPGCGCRGNVKRVCVHGRGQVVLIIVRDGGGASTDGDVNGRNRRSVCKKAGDSVLSTVLGAQEECCWF